MSGAVGRERPPVARAIFLWAVLVVPWLAACSAVVPREETHELRLLPESTDAFVPRLLWYRQSQSGTDVDEALAPPAVWGGRVFFADTRGRLVSLDARTGEYRWQRRLQDGSEAPEFTAGPTVVADAAGPTLLFGTREGEVLALRAEDGALRWRATLTSEILSAPASDGRVVVVHVNDGRVFALDVRDGKPLWVYEGTVPPLSLRGTSRPAIRGEQVFVGLANGKLAALALPDGRVLWEATVMVPQGRSELERVADVDAAPVVEDVLVYAAAYRGRVVALSRASGRLRWSRELSTYRDLLVSGGALYLTTDDGKILALERRSGSILWQQEALQGRGVTAPVSMAGRWLVVGDASGYLHWLDPEDGSLLMRHRVAEVGLPGPLMVHEGVLYFKDRHNAVYALRLERRSDPPPR